MPKSLMRRVSPRLAVVLSVATYLLAVPLLHRAGNGYFTIVSLLPVITVGLLYGGVRGIEAALVFVPVNFGLVWLIEGSIDSMLEPGGAMGTVSLFGVGWLVGYLRDLSHTRLEFLVEEKDRLIGTISHELRTPLSTVVGLSHELADRLDDFSPAEVTEFAGLIAHQSSELEALIEDLLVAARADIERISVLAIPVSVVDAVRRTVHQDGDQWFADNVQVSTPDGGEVMALADDLRVRQVVRNLLQNAKRYGGPNVEVLVERRDGYARICVCDDGAGVPVDKVDGIFEPHVRAGNGEGAVESLGLGLYVSKVLAVLMRGTLTYERSGGRTCFELALPAVAVEPVAAGRRA